MLSVSVLETQILPRPPKAVQFPIQFLFACWRRKPRSYIWLRVILSKVTEGNEVERSVELFLEIKGPYSENRMAGWEGFQEVKDRR